MTKEFVKKKKEIWKEGCQGIKHTT